MADPKQAIDKLLRSFAAYRDRTLPPTTNTGQVQPWQQVAQEASQRPETQRQVNTPVVSPLAKRTE